MKRLLPTNSRYHDSALSGFADEIMQQSENAALLAAFTSPVSYVLELTSALADDDSGVASTYGGAVWPHGEAAALLGEATAPHGETAPPYGVTAPPHGAVAPLHGVITPPYGAAPTLHGGVTAPLSGAHPSRASPAHNRSPPPAF